MLSMWRKDPYHEFDGDWDDKKPLHENLVNLLNRYIPTVNINKHHIALAKEMVNHITNGMPPSNIQINHSEHLLNLYLWSVKESTKLVNTDGEFARRLNYAINKMGAIVPQNPKSDFDEALSNAELDDILLPSHRMS